MRLLARDCSIDHHAGCEVGQWFLAVIAMLFSIFIAESV